MEVDDRLPAYTQLQQLGLQRVQGCDAETAVRQLAAASVGDP